MHNSFFKYFTIFLALSLSSVSYSFEEVLADPGDQPTFQPPLPEFKKIVENVEVPNMPKVRSQDALGVCAAFSATTIMQHRLCQKNNWDCKNLKPEQTISDAGMMLSSNVKGKRAYLGIIESTGRCVDEFLKYPIITDKCAPFNVIVNKVADPGASTALQSAMWDRLVDAHDKIQLEMLNGCKKCAANIAKSAIEKEESEGNLKFDASRTQLEKLKGFADKSWDIALTDLLVPERCQTQDTLPQNLGPIDFELFPSENQRNLSAEARINMAKEHFKKSKTPLGMSLVYFDQCQSNPKKLCNKGGHAIVLAGYRKACNPAGTCIEMFKVHNSWGQRWQEMNNDGWVDAESLIKADGVEYGNFAAYR